MNNTVLVFDFDGTIADTFHFMIKISNRLSDEFNFDKMDPRDEAVLRGKSSQEMIKFLGVPLMKIPAIIARAKKEYLKEIERLQPIDGLTTVLTQLKFRCKQIGILSSNSEENIHAFLNVHQIDVFDFIHTTPKVWSKNTCLKKLVHRYDIRKEQMVYIGDETRDVDAARKMGIKVAAVTWGFNSSQKLALHSPDFLIHHPGELLNMRFL